MTATPHDPQPDPEADPAQHPGAVPDSETPDDDEEEVFRDAPEDDPDFAS